MITKTGRLTSETPGWLTTEAGREAFARIAGKSVFAAQQATVEMLREAGDLLADPKPITHR